MSNDARAQRWARSPAIGRDEIQDGRSENVRPGMERLHAQALSAVDREMASAGWTRGVWLAMRDSGGEDQFSLGSQAQTVLAPVVFDDQLLRVTEKFRAAHARALRSRGARSARLFGDSGLIVRHVADDNRSHP